jgi:hypothetical protein
MRRLFKWNPIAALLGTWPVAFDDLVVCMTHQQFVHDLDNIIGSLWRRGNNVRRLNIGVPSVDLSQQKRAVIQLFGVKGWQPERHRQRSAVLWNPKYCHQEKASRHGDVGCHRIASHRQPHVANASHAPECVKPSLIQYGHVTMLLPSCRPPQERRRAVDSRPEQSVPKWVSFEHA